MCLSSRYHFRQKKQVWQQPWTLDTSFIQGWRAGGGAGQSRVFLGPWSRSRLKKETGPGTGAAKKFAGSPATIILGFV